MTEIGESIEWLLDRLPGEAEPTYRARSAEGDPYLAWENEARALVLTFETPHRVRFERYDMTGLKPGQTSGPPTHEGTLLIAMNLAEIGDLVLWCRGGKEQWRHGRPTTNEET